jgi:Tol biopolymer transport system component
VVKLLAVVVAALALAPVAGASTIWFATEHVDDGNLVVQIGIDGRGARTIAADPSLARSSRGAVATADGDTLRVDGRTVATVDWPIDDATFSPDGRTIAFTDDSLAKCGPSATGCATWELWLVHADGSGLREITADGKYPRFSPDGRELAFIGGYFALDSVGTAVVQDLTTGKRTWFTTAGDAAPIWAPDSNRIAYASSSVQIATLNPRRVRSLGRGLPYSFSPDGRTLLFATPHALFAGITRVATADVSDAAWSPSNWIVYVARSSKAPLDDALYRVRPDGTHGAVLRTFVPTTYLALRQVDSRSIVFTEARNRAGLATIDTVDPDTSATRRALVGLGADTSPATSPTGVLAYMKGAARGGFPCIAVVGHCLTTAHVSNGARDPAWAPDGHRLAYIDYPKRGKTELEVIDTVTHKAFVVRRFGGIVESPTWSPDGKTIVVASNDGMADEHIHLLAVDVASVGVTVLATGDPGMAPAYSPDGAKLAFVGGTWSVRSDLELYDLDTGAITDLGVQADVTRPAFSPDGSQVAFQAPDGSIHVIRADGTGDRQVAADALPGSALAWSA